MPDTNTAVAARGEMIATSSRRTALMLQGLLTVTLPFVAILWLGVPSWFPAEITVDTVTPLTSGQGLAGRLMWSLLIATGVVALQNLRGWSGRWLPPTLLLAGLAIPQAVLWTTGQSKYCVIGGLIPFSDPSLYLDFACQMLENHRIVNGFTDRSMFAAMVSSILQFTGISLQPVLAILLAFTGVGMFVAVREMRIRFGNVAAVCFLFVVYVFYNRSIGMLMTEHLGLALGLPGFALLLRGVIERRRGAWFIGLFLLTAALCARAGAFFVLPMLCLLTGRQFRKAGRFSLPMFAIAMAVVLVPFALNRLLLVRVFDPATRPKSNFSYVAYGVLRGTNWTDAMNTFGTDHEKIREATFDIIRKKPHTVLHAVRRTWRTFLWDGDAFIFMGREWSRILVASFVFALALGVARSNRGPYDGFTVAVGAGILASMPFVPPADCDFMRAYAATIPLLACLAASGIAALVRLIAPAFRRSESGPVRFIDSGPAQDDTTLVATASGALILLLVFVPPLGRSFFTAEKGAYAYLTERQPPDFPRGVALHLISDDAPRSRVPDVRVGDFRRRLFGLENNFFKKEAAWLASLPAGSSIVWGGPGGVIALPTEKLQHSDSRAEFERITVGWLWCAVDRDLALPPPEDPPASPLGENDGPR